MRAVSRGSDGGEVVVQLDPHGGGPGSLLWGAHLFLTEEIIALREKDCLLGLTQVGTDSDRM